MKHLPAQITIEQLERYSKPAWLWDGERSRIVWSNRPGIEYWGGDTLFDVIDTRFDLDEDGVQCIKELAENISNNEVIESELNFPSSGNKSALLCNCYNHNLSDGRRGLLVVAINEVTKNNVIKKTPEITASLFEMIINTSPKPTVILDNEGRVLHYNSIAEELLSVSDNMNIVEISYDDDLALVLQDKISNSADFSTICNIHNKYGERVFRGDFRHLDFDNDDYAVIVAVFEDITERRSLELGLYSEKQKLSSFIGSISEFTWGIDHGMRIHKVVASSEEYEKFIDLLTDVSIYEFINDNVIGSKEVPFNCLEKEEKLKLISSFNGHILYMVATPIDDSGKVNYVGAGFVLPEGDFYNNDGSNNTYNGDNKSNIGQDKDITPDDDNIDGNAGNVKETNENSLNDDTANVDQDLTVSIDSNAKDLSQETAAEGINNNVSNYIGKLASDNIIDIDSVEVDAMKEHIASSDIEKEVTTDEKTTNIIDESTKSKKEDNLVRNITEANTDNTGASDNTDVSESININSAHDMNDDEIDELETNTDAIGDTLDRHDSEAFSAIRDNINNKINDIKEPSKEIEDKAIYIKDKSAYKKDFVRDVDLGFEANDLNIGDYKGYNNIPIATITIFDNNIVYANDKAASLFAYPSFEDLLIDLEYEGIETIIPSLSSYIEQNNKSGNGVFDDIKTFIGYSKDGEKINLLTQFYTEENGNITLFLTPLPNIDENITNSSEYSNIKFSKSTLTGEQLQAALNTSTDGIVILKKDGEIEEVNSGAEAVFGYNSEDILGKRIQELLSDNSISIMDEYLQQLSDGGIGSVLNDGRKISAYEKNGGVISLFLAMSPIQSDIDSSSEEVKFCAVIRDMTQWQNTEIKLREAKNMAEAANNRKIELLNGLSYELRNPLCAIIGFSDMMKANNISEIGEGKYSEYLRDIRSSSEYLLNLVNDINELVKIDDKALDINPTSINLASLLHEEITKIQDKATKKRVIIRTSIAEKLPNIIADINITRKIVANLLANSLSLTKTGEQVIISALIHEASKVQLRVKDTGIGMSNEELSYIMEPFSNVEAPPKSKHKNGLSLPLTKALAEVNNANFNIESDIEKGTMVEILFPLANIIA